MTTRHWVNGDQGEYEDGTQWQDGLPVLGDTAVVATVGGPAPVDNNALIGDFYQLATGDSVTDFAGTLAPVLYPDHIVRTSGSIIIDEPGLFPTEDQIALGDTIVGQTVDLIGGGSVTGFFLQRSTFAASTTLDVSGIAVARTYYDNVLDGAVNIGTPFGVGGTPVPTPAADSHGASSELDLTISGDGSTDNSAIKLRSYVPSLTNNGVITVGDGGQLRVAFDVGPFSAISTTVDTYVDSFGGRATFINAGTLDIQPGGSTTVFSVDQLFVETNEDAIGDSAQDGDAGVFLWDSVQNTGHINVDGAAGKTTHAFLGGYVTGGGTIAVDGGTQTDNTKTLAAFDAVVNNQTFTLHNATLAFYDDVLGNTNRVFGGGITLQGNADLLVDPSTLPDGVGYGPPTYSIPGSPGYTGGALDQAFGTPITGFANGDTLAISVASDLVDYQDTYIPIWNQAANTLVIERSAQAILVGGTPTLTNVATFTLEGSYASGDFTVLSVSSPSSDPLTGQPFFGDLVQIGLVPCFAEGTRVATPFGMTAVECLRVGDHVLTAGSEIRPIVWIGCRTVDCATHPEPSRIQPICIPAHAFGSCGPHRDLYLSPDHALLRHGELVPAKYLVGQHGIAQVDVPSVTYWHVELETHEILLAEGLACESLLPGTGRDALAQEVIGLVPALPRASASLRWEAFGAAPIGVAAAR